MFSITADCKSFYTRCQCLYGHGCMDLPDDYSVK